MAITRTAMVDDDGSGTTGTIINNAWKTEFYNQIDAAVYAPRIATIKTDGTATIPPSAWTPMPLPTMEEDSGGFTGITPNRLVIPAGAGGLYVVVIDFSHYEATPAAGAAVSVNVTIAGSRLNAVTTAFYIGIGAAASLTVVQRLSAGTSVGVEVYQTHTAALAGPSCRLSTFWVAP